MNIVLVELVEYEITETKKSIYQYQHPDEMKSTYNLCLEKIFCHRSGFWTKPGLYFNTLVHKNSNFLKAIY